MGLRSLRPRSQQVDYKESGQAAPSTTPSWVKLKPATEEADRGKGLELDDAEKEKASIVPKNKENEKPASNNKKGRGEGTAAVAAKQQPDNGRVKQAQGKKSAKEPADVQPIDAADEPDEPEKKAAKGTGKTVRKAKVERRHTVAPVVQPEKAGSPSITTRSRGAKRIAEDASLSEAESKGKKKARHSLPAEASDKHENSDKHEKPGPSQKQGSGKAAEEAQLSQAQGTRNGGVKGADKPAKPEANTKMHGSSKRVKGSPRASKAKGAEEVKAAAQPADPQPKKGAVAGKGKVRLDSTAELSRLEEEGNEPAQPSAAAATGNFRKLQEEFSLLHAKYQEVKAQRIQDVEGAIQEIRAQEQAHSKKAMQLAAHWEAEAQRQAAIAQQGDLAALQKELDALQAEFTNAKMVILDQEAKVLEKEEENAELKRSLGEMIRLVDAYRESRQNEDDAEQAFTEREEPEEEAGTAAGLHRSREGQSQVQGSSAKKQAASLDARQSVVKSAKAALSRPAAGVSPRTALPSSAENNTPQIVKPAGPHIKEAAAWCPEGASLSEPYLPPTGVAAVSQSQGGGPPAGLVQCNSSAKPLVPYTVGCSVNQQRLAKSRFAAEAASEGAAEPGLPAPLQNKLVTHLGEEFCANEPAAEQAQAAFAPTNTGLKSNQGSRAQSPHVERQLTYTPGSIREQDALRAVDMLSRPLAVSDGSPSDVSHTDPLSMISNVTNKGMVNLVGLQILGPTARGGFSYSHPETGFVFEISPSASTDSDEEEFDFAFKPLDLGRLANAQPQLPDYLRGDEDIRFASKQRLMLVSRIMEHLGRFQRAE